MTLALAITFEEHFDAMLEAAPRFWRHVQRTANCWLWTGPVMTAGYGQMGFVGRRVGAHRFSFFVHHGDLIAGMVICHSCHNRLCVNPGHLSQGTYHDNYLDTVERLQAIPDGCGGYDAELWALAFGEQSK